MKKTTGIILAGIVAASLFSFSAVADDTYTINLATCWANDHPTTVAIDEVFIPYITEHTDGKVVVNHYPNSTLGTEQDMYEQVMNGSIEMAALGNLFGNNVIAEMNVQELPFMFEEEDEFWTIANDPESDFWNACVDACAEKGVDLLTFYKRGFRQITSDRAIESIDDIKGIVMRTPPEELKNKIWQALGANCSVIAWNEVYTALQQHTVNGSEGSLDSIYSQKLYEVQDYLALGNYILSVGELTANSAWFASLPEEYQQVIEEAGLALRDEVYKSISEHEEGWIADMEANGVTVTHPDRESMKAACLDVVKEYVENTECAAGIMQMLGKEDYLDELGIAY